jgi:hypothetical protein
VVLPNVNIVADLRLRQSDFYWQKYTNRNGNEIFKMQTVSYKKDSIINGDTFSVNADSTIKVFAWEPILPNMFFQSSLFLSQNITTTNEYIIPRSSFLFENVGNGGLGLGFNWLPYISHRRIFSPTAPKPEDARYLYLALDATSNVVYKRMDVLRGEDTATTQTNAAVLHLKAGARLCLWSERLNFFGRYNFCQVISNRSDYRLYAPESHENYMFVDLGAQLALTLSKEQGSSLLLEVGYIFNNGMIQHFVPSNEPGILYARVGFDQLIRSISR